MLVSLAAPDKAGGIQTIDIPAGTTSLQDAYDNSASPAEITLAPAKSFIINNGAPLLQIEENGTVLLESSGQQLLLDALGAGGNVLLDCSGDGGVIVDSSGGGNVRLDCTGGGNLVLFNSGGNNTMLMSQAAGQVIISSAGFTSPPVSPGRMDLASGSSIILTPNAGSNIDLNVSGSGKIRAFKQIIFPGIQGSLFGDGGLITDVNSGHNIMDNSSGGGDTRVNNTGGGGGVIIQGDGGGQLGFFGLASVVKPVGVAVTAAAIHAALTSLGLIAP